MDNNNKVRLRALEPEDAEMMYRAEDDPAAWRYSDYLAPLSLEQLRHYALTYDPDPFRSGQLRLIIEADGAAAGLLDLFDVSARHLRAETGIYLLSEYRNKGLGTLSLERAKEYCLERLGLHQLTAEVAVGNKEAIRCFRNAGFIPAGKRHDWLRTADGYEDVELLWTKL